MTRYVVLHYAREREVWHVMDTGVEASSSEHAVRRHVDGRDSVDGVYVAVPERSWQPVAVQTELKTRVSVNQAAPATAAA
jgi:hypothetical protein